ncbi:pyroglutamyl-peptidase I [Rivibacter subsaxonicus]|uniref:Pyrrolidone-carboxylate peptidase n=1 Tax=Rivibacter subsaxonicus TaxID=457575 RepID=A0A4Q7W0J2_9BURK|nr:pyroglutamyl-peptidase I [Rivibacter subsaxonicus]
MRVLLTGFEPFGGETINPSWLAARALDGERIGGAMIVACELPCVFDAALQALDSALADCDPMLVIALGQAAGRCDLSFERVAVNLDDARIPDNAGAQPIDRSVIAGAPAAHFGTLPVKAIVATLRQQGIPASLSMSAGSFVCNHLFFGLMHRLAARPGVRGGFVHLPLLPEQAARHPGQPSLPLATMVEGLRVAIEVALATREDLRVAGGEIA